MMLCAPVFTTAHGVRLLSSSPPIDGKGMKNLGEEELSPFPESPPAS